MRTATRPLFATTLGLTLAFAGAALANPRPLPFTYPYEQLSEGQTEIEAYTDVTPLRVYKDGSDRAKGRQYEPYYKLQTEIEYGVTDRLELGFYQVFVAKPQTGGGNSMSFDGLKWRARYRFAEAGEWPVDVAVYLEVAWLHDEIEWEEKIILQKRFGNLKIMGNLWIEQELADYWQRGKRELEFIVNPTLGLTYQVVPVFSPGIEYWARGMLDADEYKSDPVKYTNHRLTHFVGPAVHLNFGRVWWTVAAYPNLSNADNPHPGEKYGPVWFRSLLGVEL
jgi:hypothetical protein